MCDKVQHQLNTTISSTPSSQSNHNHHDTNHKNISTNYMTNLPHFILEPNQDTMLALTSPPYLDHSKPNHHNHHHTNHHHYHNYHQHQALLHDYFKTTYLACMACTNLLTTMKTLRAHHHSIHFLLSKLSNTPQHECNCTMTTLHKLATLIKLENPIVQSQTLAQLHYVQKCYTILLHQLTLAHKRLRKRLKLIKMFRRGARIISEGACAMVALVLCACAAVRAGVVAVGTVPGAVAQEKRRSGRETEVRRVGRQVEAAARGAYIMEKELESVSRMVQRVQDEVEHESGVAGMAVRFTGERWAVRGVEREVAGGRGVVEERMGEVEEHVCLCLMNINRSRRMVAHEIVSGVGD